MCTSKCGVSTELPPGLLFISILVSHILIVNLVMMRRSNHSFHCLLFSFLSFHVGSPMKYNCTYLSWAVPHLLFGLLQENMMLKEQMEALIQENIILKRAVSIQHERQKEYEDRNQELQQLKQLVSQYQEQVRTLEVNNYALTMHLKQAQQSNSIPGRYHPDVF